MIQGWKRVRLLAIWCIFDEDFFVYLHYQLTAISSDGEWGWFRRYCYHIYLEATPNFFYTASRQNAKSLDGASLSVE